MVGNACLGIASSITQLVPKSRAFGLDCRCFQIPKSIRTRRHRTGSNAADMLVRTPLRRWKPLDWPELAKQFPHGFFIIKMDLVAFYVPIVVKESTTFDAVLAQTNIRPEDIVYNDSSAITDASGKVITQHDVVYWLTDLHLSGQKYVP